MLGRGDQSVEPVALRIGRGSWRDAEAVLESTRTGVTSDPLGRIGRCATGFVGDGSGIG